jgi:hypothetical protein
MPSSQVTTTLNMFCKRWKDVNCGSVQQGRNKLHLQVETWFWKVFLGGLKLVLECFALERHSGLGE